MPKKIFNTTSKPSSSVLSQSMMVSTGFGVFTRPKPQKNIKPLQPKDDSNPSSSNDDDLNEFNNHKKSVQLEK